ncbi:MAG: hypothetical protein QOD77_536 [Thermoplasmata archaeon]|nr:hypothetical protein [Thermoplasmata archaeon]
MRALLAILLLLALPAAEGHNTYQAQELEVHVLNDEGSDAIEAYGGYDITEVFVGGAYVQGIGDALYFRIEAYGRMEDTNGAMPWSLKVRFRGAGEPVERTLTTADGATFESDFDALQFEVEDRDLHVQRAVVALASVFLQPGDPIKDLVVESYFGDDLRDVAPGGIPVPGTGGALEYPDPTQIDGQGRLVEAPPAPSPEAYFGEVRATLAGANYTLEVDNALTAGGQHFFLRDCLCEAPGWEFAITKGAQEVAANGTATFTFHAQAGPEAAARELELISDVGGRLPMTLDPDGTLRVRDQSFAPPPAVPAPLPLAVVALGLAGALATRRR